MTTAAEQGKQVQCTCRQARVVYLKPSSLAPGFVFGRCGACGKKHTYPENAVPLPPTPEPAAPAPVSGASDPDVDILMEGDLVRMTIPRIQRTITLGKIIGNEFRRFENGKGVHVASDSFGIPYVLLKFLEAKKVKFMQVHYGGMVYSTTTENWRARGKFLYFKGIAEKRIHLSRADFK